MHKITMHGPQNVKSIKEEIIPANSSLTVKSGLKFRRIHSDV